MSLQCLCSITIARCRLPLKHGEVRADRRALRHHLQIAHMRREAAAQISHRNLNRENCVPTTWDSGLRGQSARLYSIHIGRLA